MYVLCYSYLRYGASSTVVDNIAWLVGGVTLSQLDCEILMLDLANKTWQACSFPSHVSIIILQPKVFEILIFDSTKVP